MPKFSLAFAATVVLAGAMMVNSGKASTNERGIDPANFDDTCKPCQDFYEYANGNWLKTNPIPAAYSSWSVWNEINDRNSEILHDILETSAANTSAPKGSAAQKIGDFYATAMDSATIEAQGAMALKPDMDRIDTIKDKQEFIELLIDYHKKGMTFLFDGDAEQDLKKSDQYLFYASQGGLGLPDRDYYTRDDEDSKKIRDEYLQHVAKMLVLTGEPEAQAKTDAEKIMAIETKLAEASLTNVELRDPSKSYNVVSVDEADSETPNFSWKAYFSGIGLPQVTEFSFSHPKFFAEMNQLLADVPLDDWKAYLRWQVVDASANYLSSEFVNQDFDFFQKTLQGTKELRPRWKRVLGVMNWRMGELLGQLFVERAFPPKSKERAVEMVNNLILSLRDRLTNLDWMSAETKQKALAKLATITPKIGYPDKWRDYSALDIERTSYLDNMRRCRAFSRQYNLNKIGKPVDRTEWGMPPQIVNAYYNPVMNEIVFPAAILQPPFFDGTIDDAVNYGAMGAVIGHEMLHGYDDEGSQFDAEGNMEDWWTSEDRTKFEERTAKLVDQFNNYVAVDDVHVNGQLTLGENIADLGGLTVSYYALQKALAGKPNKLIDGFTPEQRFFLSWAQVWRTNYRPEALKLQVNTDPHSPANVRVDGPLSNMQEFRDAFHCANGDPMVRSGDLQVKIW